MKILPMAALTANRSAITALAQCTFLALAPFILLAPPQANAADPEKPPAAAKNIEVTVESIAGSAVKRVTLSAKAAQRLGIETGKVGEQLIVRKQMVSGLITVPADKQPEQKPGGTFGGFGQSVVAPMPSAPAPAAPAKPGGGLASPGKVVASQAGVQKLPLTAMPAQTTPALVPVASVPGGPGTLPVALSPRANLPISGDAWVQVTLSPGEWERLAKGRPARLLALSTRDTFGTEILAQPSGMAPVEDLKRTMLTVYYVVPGVDHGLTLNSRVRVELQNSGDEEQHKVVPYGAVYYDGNGAAWVYVNTKPLTFERQRIGVERIVGDLAVLSDGPPAGTPIVTVGASLLFGSELFGK
ncbi:MAG: hypothetical protein ABIV07_00480 [Polaromonas sp.]